MLLPGGRSHAVARAQVPGAGELHRHRLVPAVAGGGEDLVSLFDVFVLLLTVAAFLREPSNLLFTEHIARHIT